MTISGLYLDDGNVMPILRELIDAMQALGPSKGLKTLSCQALSRLDYPMLQTMLALQNASKGTIQLCDCQHLEEPLKRYGFDRQLQQSLGDE